jgi:hypothetical protein
VFDGLDEVPSDVKDLVAGEVRHFIDNILVECSADALTVCTSRPQGYAGQFADLEAPIIELSSLSPQQALNCAKPLLEIERSSEESQIYFNTLRAAVESPSVREIMTTPLQAHIMAVVVRDGGRPPERKWQLFNNFYQVIKKREANRNLPNKKLAKLLREGDLLLKALHNRLGFELHSRAETSRGAQTSLKRSELQDLVHETVAKLQNVAVDETVNVLMEATTERLVLVSTPESGQEVRFDIRPLQEFFAAELFYELVQAEALGERRRIVAGDAHWREVMHYLLSALVENGRQTEWTVAVDSLNYLNESNGDPNIRVAYRRLASGSILAARLLQEGVLEQNKGSRQQIRKVLEPLFGNTDMHAAGLLAKVSQVHSKGWLQDALIDQLHDAAEPGSIGAAAALAYGLPDEHVRSNEAEETILGMSSDYRSCLFSILSPEIPSHSGKLPTWAVSVVLRSLLSPEWTNLSRNGIRSAFQILSTNRKNVGSLLRSLNLATDALKVYEAALCGRIADRGGFHKEVASERCGIIRVRYNRCEAALEYSHWTNEGWDELARTTTGVMRLINGIFRLAKARTRTALLELIELASNNVIALDVLPTHIKAYLPCGPSDESGGQDRTWSAVDNIALWETLNDSQVARLFEQKRIGCVPDYYIENEPKNIKGPEWEKTIQRFPDFALHLFSREDCSRSKEPYLDGQAYLEQKEGARALALKVLDHPTLLLSFPEAWGKLFRVCPELEEQLRARLVLVSTRPVVSEKRYVGQIYPFALDLPSEAPLLAHVVSVLIDKAFPADPMLFLVGEEGARIRAFPRERLGNWTIEFCKTVSSLVEIVDDGGFPSPVRAAAAMMVLLHPESSEAVRRSCERALVQLYDPSFLREVVYEGGRGLP